MGTSWTEVNDVTAEEIREANGTTASSAALYMSDSNTSTWVTLMQHMNLGTELSWTEISRC